MLGLEYFEFRDLWSPFFLSIILCIGVLYYLLGGKWRHKFADSEPLTKIQMVSFTVGLLLFYLAQRGPIDLLAHLMFSAHMIAMAIKYIIVPPLIIIGIPSWMWKQLIQFPTVKRTITALTHPILALLMFNMLFSFYHMPFVLDTVMTNFMLYWLYAIVLQLSALIMWWVVLCPVPEMDTLTEVRKMGYIFANGALLTPSCGLIIFASEPLFGTFSDPLLWSKALGYCVPASSAALLASFSGPEFFALIPPLDDQQFGAITMKLTQEIVYGVVLMFLFAKWFKRDNSGYSVDPIDPEMMDFSIPEQGQLNKA